MYGVSDSENEKNNNENNHPNNNDETANLSYLSPSNMQSYVTSDLSQMETSHVPKLVLRSKVVIVGDPTVGKSAITQMFHSMGHMYPKNYIMTSSCDFSVREVAIPNTAASVELYMFDCAGQSIFNQREMNLKYWENANFVVCVYDVSNRESFNSCAKWVQNVRSVRPNTGGGPLPGLLLANKTDLRLGGINSRAVIDSGEGQALAQNLGLEYFECSALTGRDVDRPFNFIASQYHLMFENTVRRSNAANSQGQKF